jgi:hypothetical protein
MPEPIVAYWEALPVWITFGLKVLALLLLLGIAIWGWVRWPKREAARLALKIRDAKARADVEEKDRRAGDRRFRGPAGGRLGLPAIFRDYPRKQVRG